MDSKNAYNPEELLIDLRRGIFSELYTGKLISVYRRNLQKTYLDKLIQILNPKGAPYPGTEPDNNDVSTIVKMEIKALHTLVKSAIAKTRDRMSKGHLIDLNERLINFYKDKK